MKSKQFTIWHQRKLQVIHKFWIIANQWCFPFNLFIKILQTNQDFCDYLHYNMSYLFTDCSMLPFSLILHFKWEVKYFFCFAKQTVGFLWLSLIMECHFKIFCDILSILTPSDWKYSKHIQINKISFENKTTNYGEITCSVTSPQFN